MQNALDHTAETIGDIAATARKPVRIKQTLCRRVREALVALGGEAHRSIVIEQVARNLGHDVRQIPEDLQAEVIVSFERTWADERKRAAWGFHLPFGEGSHRWSVRPDVLAA